MIISIFSKYNLIAKYKNYLSFFLSKKSIYITATSRAKYRCDMGGGYRWQGASLPRDFWVVDVREWPTPVVVSVNQAHCQSPSKYEKPCECSSRVVTRRARTFLACDVFSDEIRVRDGSRVQHATRGCHRGRPGDRGGGDDHAVRR